MLKLKNSSLICLDKVKRKPKENKDKYKYTEKLRISLYEHICKFLIILKHTRNSLQVVC